MASTLARTSVLTVRGLSGLLQPSAVQRFRQDGVVVVKGFLSDTRELDDLAHACHNTCVARGQRLFPGLDDEFNGRVEFGARMEKRAGGPASSPSDASASPALSEDTAARLPPHVHKRAAEVDANKEVDRRVRHVHLTLKNSKQVDRAYRSLTRTRDRYNKMKNVPNYVDAEEEASGAISDERIAEVQSKYQYEDIKRSFEEYRDSGKMEAEVRRGLHVNDAMAMLQNWSKTWTHVWPESAALRDAVGLTTTPQSTQCRAGSIGSRVGQAAAALTGEVVMRLFSDNIQQSVRFTNATPFHFTALAANYKHPHAMTVTVGLAHDAGVMPAPVLVLPGSHRVLRALTKDGTDTSRFPLNHVFDMGRLLRLTPELGGPLEVTTLPPLASGDAVFMSDFMMTASMPSLDGSAEGPYVAPADAHISHPNTYVLSLVPDRCAFDGERTSWHARDSHGPLYAFKKGQLLTDERRFPALYRGLDIA